MGRDPYIGAVAKMVNAPDWKSGYGGSSPPRSTIAFFEYCLCKLNKRTVYKRYTKYILNN